MDRGIPGRLPVGGRGIAGGGIGAVILIVLALVFGIDPTMLLQGTTTSYVEPEPAPRGAPAPADDDATRFVAVVLAETEDTWNGLFAQMGRRYEEPKLVVFNGAVRSACGFADAAVGPFYCPGDRNIYLDLSFFEDLRRRFGAPGDFAQAYVIAHEVGHHVQTLLGISPRVEALRRQSGELDANRLSVMMELQADCFAGVWAHRAKAGGQLLEPGDIEEALNAANAIGDDRMQARVRGYVVPDSFTHGSSAQRVAWFRRGLASGSPEVCDTFSAAGL
jgi:hypothetical protein